MSNQIVAKFKNYDKIVMQDEQLQNWQKGLFGKQVQHSCMGRIKSKLKTMDNVYVLDRNIPTTKICMNCGKIHEMDLSDRKFQCDCGFSEDRDVHAAKNMLEILHLIEICNLLPPEQRNVKRAEFLTACSNKFELSHGTMKHEDATFQGCH